MKTGVFRYPAMVAEFSLPGEVVENAAACWSGLIHPHDETHFWRVTEIADGRAESTTFLSTGKKYRGEWISLDAGES